MELTHCSVQFRGFVCDGRHDNYPVIVRINIEGDVWNATTLNVNVVESDFRSSTLLLLYDLHLHTARHISNSSIGKLEPHRLGEMFHLPLKLSRYYRNSLSPLTRRVLWGFDGTSPYLSYAEKANGTIKAPLKRSDSRVSSSQIESSSTKFFCFVHSKGIN
ncbi:hypothetical protein [Archaeoglobus sp.]